MGAAEGLSKAAGAFESIKEQGKVACLYSQRTPEFSASKLPTWSFVVSSSEVGLLVWW